MAPKMMQLTTTQTSRKGRYEEGTITEEKRQGQESKGSKVMD